MGIEVEDQGWLPWQRPRNPQPRSLLPPGKGRLRPHYCSGGPGGRGSEEGRTGRDWGGARVSVKAGAAGRKRKPSSRTVRWQGKRQRAQVALQEDSPGRPASPFLNHNIANGIVCIYHHKITSQTYTIVVRMTYAASAYIRTEILHSRS